MGKFILLSVALPALVALATAGLAFFLSRKPGVSSRGWSAPLAVGLPFVLAGPFILNKSPEWPPSQAADWLPFLGVAALVLGLIDIALPRARWVYAALFALLAGYAAFVYHGPLASAASRLMGEGATKITWIAAIGAVLTLPALAARAGARHTPNAGPPFALGILTAATIAAGLLSETAKLAQFASLLGLGLAPLGVITLIRRPWAIDRGLPLVFAPLLATIWLLLHFYADAHWLAAILGAISPAALLIACLPGLSRSPKTAGIVQVAVAAALAAATLGVLVANKPAPASGDDDASQMYPGS